MQTIFFIELKFCESVTLKFLKRLLLVIIKLKGFSQKLGENYENLKVLYRELRIEYSYNSIYVSRFQGIICHEELLHIDK